MVRIALRRLLSVFQSRGYPAPRIYPPTVWLRASKDMSVYTRPAHELWGWESPAHKYYAFFLGMFKCQYDSTTVKMLVRDTVVWLPSFYDHMHKFKLVEGTIASCSSSLEGDHA